ncbi:hypothetical protein MVEN_02576800 [Mycena venus]|uniref:Uncharacterized protein n=1 Tax=Mycena venus TaxID=2733690 RepID=A0A8H6U344_9AGAR|nr:hypothetical protein MVEN_02576800 [Mycena venus]
MSQQTVRIAAQSFRNVHSSSAVRATMADVPVTLPPIFDIFDVPVRLRKTSPASEPARQPRPRETSSLSGRALNPMPTPTSLPNPLVFEGPAGRRPVARQHHERASASSYAPRHGAEPVITIFDGPARSGGRTQRPQTLGSKSTVPKGRNLRLAMGAAAATAVTFAVAHSWYVALLFRTRPLTFLAERLFRTIPWIM